MDLGGVAPVEAQGVIALLMWVPAVVAYVVGRFVTRVGFEDCGLRSAPSGRYVMVLVLAPILFGVTYGLTWAFGLGRPDWSLASFERLLPLGLPSDLLSVGLTAVITNVFLLSVVISPFINVVFAFGEEFAWRGFLLPKLLPLGPGRALLVSGLVWGIWHAPLVYAGFNYSGHYPGHPWLGMALMTIFTTLVGAFIGGLGLAYGSVYLAAFAHGAIDSQVYGIWRALFADSDPVTGGVFGLTGLAVWGALAVWVWLALWRKPAEEEAPRFSNSL